MSASHDRPKGFLEWLTNQPEGDIRTTVGPGTFAPRLLFGAYIRAMLNDESKRSGRDRLELVKGDGIGLIRGGMHRHRMAAQTADWIDVARVSGQ